MLLNGQVDVIPLRQGNDASLEVLGIQGKPFGEVADALFPDGFEVLAYMNRDKWIEDIPVIMISSEGSESYIRRAYELGASDYISRPFDTKVVYQRLGAKPRRYTTLSRRRSRRDRRFSPVMPFMVTAFSK